jgi:tetratricopeptide (TPR) repeat protein
MPIRPRLVLALALAVLPVVAHAVAPEELADLEAKAQYAFLAEDGNMLQGLASESRALAASEQPLELYHYAHVRFRQLQFATFAGLKREAVEAGEDCVAALDRATARQAEFAEAIALQASCHGYLASLSAVTGLPSMARASARIGAAARLDPRGPRVLLAEATSLYFRPPALGGDRQRAVQLLERATAAFEPLDAPHSGEPTWGAAEAWFLLGRAREEAGDVLAARDAYEKALLAAPHFVRAKRRLAVLTGR